MELILVLPVLLVLPVVCWAIGLVFRVMGWTLKAVFSLLGIFLFPLILLAGLAQGALFLAIPAGLCWLAYSIFVED